MYYRVVKMSGKIYAKAFDDLDIELNDISDFLYNGEIILLCDDLEGVADLLGVSVDEIIIAD